MFSNFFSKLLNLSRRNGTGATFFACLVAGILLIAVGFSLRSLENQKNQFNNVLMERLRLAKGKFELSKLKIEYEYKKAIESIDKFKDEYSKNIESLKKDFEQKLAEFDIGQKKSIIENQIKFEKELNKLRRMYTNAKDELLRIQEVLNLEFETFKIQQKESVIETNRKHDEDFSKASDAYEQDISKALDAYKQDFSKASDVYEQEIIKMSFVRSEIEGFLDEIQNNLQELEKKITAQLPNEPDLDLGRLILVRMKLNAFLSEYREKMERIKEYTPPRFEYILSEFEYIPLKLVDVKIAKPMFLDQENVSQQIQLLEDGLMNIAMTRSKYLRAAEVIDLDSVFEIIAAPRFSPTPPEINLSDVISTKGLESLIVSGKFWMLPTTSGVILIMFSIIFGFYVIQEERHHTPNKANPADARTSRG